MAENFDEVWFCVFCRRSDRHLNTERETKAGLKEHIVETHVHKANGRGGILRGIGKRTEVGA